MSSAGAKEIVGAIEIVVGAYTGQTWLVDLGIETMVAGGLQELANLLAPAPLPSAQNGIVRSSVASQQIIYGQVKTGGVVVFSDSYGSNNEFLCVGISHTLTEKNGSTGLPIEGVSSWYVNDVEIPVAYWNSSTGAITAGPGG